MRELKLVHLALRACDVGRNVQVLNMLKHFFGCTRISAPKDLDVFVTLEPDPGPTAIPGFQGRHPQAKIGGTAPNRWGLHISALYEFDVAFESQAAVKQWIKTHLPVEGSYSTGGLPAHGMALSVGKKHFAWAGEKAYVNHPVKV